MMVTLRAAYEWDIAAGSLIATEAGAAVTDGDGAALVFNRHPARAPARLRHVAAGLVHGFLTIKCV